jgi:hypothetical protein
MCLPPAPVSTIAFTFASDCALRTRPRSSSITAARTRQGTEVCEHTAPQDGGGTEAVAATLERLCEDSLFATLGPYLPVVEH